MSGPAIRQQGPFGAVTASRTLIRPRPPRRIEAVDVATAHLGDATSRPFIPAGENPEPAANSTVFADSGTLFAAQMLAPAEVAGRTAAGLLMIRNAPGWAPPESALRLRDRRV